MKKYGVRLGDDGGSVEGHEGPDMGQRGDLHVQMQFPALERMLAVSTNIYCFLLFTLLISI